MGFIRKLVVAATALIAVVGATVLTTAAPAQAREPICWWTYSVETGWVEHCVDLPILWDPHWWMYDCPNCVPVFDPRDHWLKDPEQLKLGDRLADVILYGAAARFAQDPKEAGLYLDYAANAGLDAAKLYGEYEFKLERVAWYDVKSGKTLPAQEELLLNAGAELTEAMRLFQKAHGDPDPQPSIEAALAHLGKAVDALSELNKG